MNDEDALVDMINQISEITGKSILAGIPIFGSPIVEIIDSVKANCLENRQNKWLQELDDRISKVEYDVNQLGNDEFFTSALLKATEIAAKTHEDDKRKYLANAVVNSIDIPSEEETTKMILLDIVDKYTVLHIKMLTFLHNPKEHVSSLTSLYSNASPMLLIENHREFRSIDKELIKKIINDLDNDGLISGAESYSVVMSAEGAMNKRTTKLGEELLSFISEVESRDIPSQSK